MWGLFYASAFMAALFLYLPGYLFLRALRIARLISVVCAPLVTISSYGGDEHRVCESGGILLVVYAFRSRVNSVRCVMRDRLHCGEEAG